MALPRAEANTKMSGESALKNSGKAASVRVGCRYPLRGALPFAPGERFPDARFRQPPHFHKTWREGTHQHPARRFKRKTLSSSTNQKNSGKLQIVMKENRYEMIIWWSVEDDVYVVDVPELPGCMAHGTTRQTAIKNAEAAIKFWIRTAKDDGSEIPQPRGRLLVA